MTIARTGRQTRKAPRTRAAKTRVVDGGPLHILMVASEAYPFATTGGLGEVTGGLAHTLARLGHRVTLVVPRYSGVRNEGPSTSSGALKEITLSLGGHAQRVGFAREDLGEGLNAVLIEAPELFDRDGLYGSTAGDFPDNARRFAVFCRASLEYSRISGERPSVIHIHDWQAGLVPAYQKMLFSDDPIVGRVPAVFTIHNLAFQGLFPPATLDAIGLGWNVFNPQAMEHWGRISYLKAGINFSELITTVSPTYAREILSPETGLGFEGVLNRRSNDLVAILNGIDTQRWNPAKDLFLPTPFDARRLAGKRKAKKLLLDTVGLPSEDASVMVIGMVSRLTDQKGMDLIAAAADNLMALDAVWVMLGSGEARYEEWWTRLAARFPRRVATIIGFDERLIHLIEAGADAFLMPSRFEPCGLNQMYSFRYGTVPIVHATGGLEDTVEDYDSPTGRGTGFTFHDYTPSALVAAVTRAVELFRTRAAWRKVQQAGMRLDHSWDVSAREYVKVYRRGMAVFSPQPTAPSQELSVRQPDS